MRYRLRDVFPFRRAKAAVAQVSSDFYLSVLAAKAPLPAVTDVLSPGGEAGRVAGMGVPLAAGASKADLVRSMERGVYALSSPDQKTLLKLRVFSKEEAGFDPELVARSALSSGLDAEVLQRIRATWTILQLTVEAYDPALTPALRFLIGVAQRLAVLVEGVVADPLSEDYRKPGDFMTPDLPDGELDVRDFVSVKPWSDEGVSGLRTAGLLKFAHPELHLQSVPRDSGRLGERFLLSISSGVLRGKTLEPGDRLVSERGWIVGEPALRGPEWNRTPALELLPVKGTVAEALSAWVEADAS